MHEPLAVWDDSIRLDFTSAARDHQAFVRFELWPDEPPEPEESWAAGNTVKVRFTSGVIQLWSVTMGPSREAGPVDMESTGLHHARVSRRGAAEAATMSRNVEPIPHGTERYLIQLWKARRRRSSTPPRG